MDPLRLITAMTVAGSMTCSTLQETTSEFSCCDHTVSYSHDFSCEHMWSDDKLSIAEMSPGTVKCESPCKKIEPDHIILDRCVNVTVATVCTVNGVIMEKQVTYHAQICSRPLTNSKPTENQGSVGFLLLAVMTGGFLHIIS